MPLRISSKLLFSHSLSSTASRFALTGMPIPSACVVLYVGATGNHWPLGDVPYATGPREQAARVDFVARAGQQPSRRSQGGSTRRHGHLPRSARMSRMTSARAGFGCRTNQRRKTTAETTRSTTRSADTSGVYCNAAQTMPVDAIFEIRTWLPAFGHEKSPRERAWGVEGLGWWLALQSRAVPTEVAYSDLLRDGVVLSPLWPRPAAIFEIRTWLPAFGHEKSPRERAWGVEGLGWWLALQSRAVPTEVAYSDLLRDGVVLSPLWPRPAAPNVERSALTVAATARR